MEILNCSLINFSDTENTQKGFEGCIYRVQIDNIFPLKRAFQDPRPDYIKPVPRDGMLISAPDKKGSQG